MKIFEWNVNGIRAVHRKGDLQAFIAKYDPDILCINETKAQEDKLGQIIKEFDGFDQYYHSAEKPGYAGTAIWVKKGLLSSCTVLKDMPTYDDKEGRVIGIEFDGFGSKVVLFSIYFPNGGKSSDAWKEKLVFYDHFLQYVNKLRKAGKEVIWTGDINCAHNEIDLTRAKENDGKIGFHPDERAWLNKVVKDNWVDVFRHRNPEKVVYSYWDLFTRARDRNVGWRIDYFFVDSSFEKKVKDVRYITEQMGSDHCPVLLEL